MTINVRARRHGIEPSCVPVVVVVVVVVLCCCCLGSTRAAETVQLHRVIQAKIQGSELGAVARNSKGFASLPVRGSKSKSIIVVPLSKLEDYVVEDVSRPGNGMEGLVVVLPQGYQHDDVAPVEQHQLLALESVLTSTRVQVPVYFAVQNGALQSLIHELQHDADADRVPSAQTGGIELTVKGDPPTIIRQHPVINFAGVLHASQVAAGQASQAPTILVTAHYDTFAAAPTLAGGADGNGSGVAVLLQLMRTFHRLYSTAASRGSFNIMFLVTGGGHLNFEGTHQWLNDADASLLENLEFVLCLDSLGGAAASGQLHLHYSKPPKEEAVARWYNAVERGARAAGLELHMVHKKINVATTQLSWAHEHLSRRRILAATLSALPTPPPPHQRSSILDTPARSPSASLALAHKAVAEFLAHMVYPQAFPDLDLLDLGPSGAQADSSAASFLARWTHLLTSTPRMIPFYAATDPLNSALLTFFRDHSDHSTQHVWRTDARHEFANCTAALMTIVRQHGLHVDCVVLLLGMLYLGALFAVLRIASRGWADFVNMLDMLPKRKHA